jgi:hypothetical protein
MTPTNVGRRRRMKVKQPSFAILLSAVAMIMASSVSAGEVPRNEASGAAHSFTLSFDGGTAYVHTPDKRAHVGPLSEAHAGSHYHRMFLELQEGSVDSVSTGEAHPWPLADRETHVCPDGLCHHEGLGDLKQSADQGTAGLRCGKDAIDDIAYVPHLTAMHPEYRLTKDWQSVLSGRVVLSVGRLRVHTRYNCYFLKNDALETKEQALADGLQGISYQVPFKKYLLLELRTKDESKTTRIRLKPTADGRITMRLKVHGDPPSPIVANGDKEIEEFNHFYVLLRHKALNVAVPDEQRFKLFLKHGWWFSQQTAGNRTPGSSCPPARFTALE